MGHWRLTVLDLWSSLPASDIARKALEHSDIGEHAILTRFVELFGEAHRSAPGGGSLEIGTRAGGSAYAFLLALQHLYKRPPMFFTVDPYGEIPYPKGNIDHTDYRYGDSEYLRAKALLAPFPNHTHFLLRSVDFWQMAGMPYWQGGEGRTFGDFSFVFLDGDHSPASVVADVAMSMRYLREGGMVLIDNVNWQTDLAPALACLGNPAHRDERWAAIQK